MTRPGPTPIYDMPTPKKLPITDRLQRMDARITRCHWCGSQTQRQPDRICHWCRTHGHPSDVQHQII